MGMTSRLFREVREKRGLCYSVSTFTEYYDDAGYMATYAGVEPDLAKVQEAVTVIMHEHELIKKELVPQDELDRAKELIKGRLILSMEDTFNVAATYGTKELFQNKLFDMDDYIARIDAITSEDVRSIAQEVCVPDQRNFALIGPFKGAKITF